MRIPGKKMIRIPLTSSKYGLFLVTDDVAIEWRLLKKELDHFHIQKLCKLIDQVHETGIRIGNKDVIDDSTRRRGRGIRKDATIKTAGRVCERLLNMPKGSVIITLPSGKHCSPKHSISTLRKAWSVK